MAARGYRSALVASLSDIYYLTGRIFRGYIYLDPAADGPIYFVRQPNHLTGKNVHMVRKPEEIPAILARNGIAAAGPVALELNSLTYAEALRLNGVFGQDTAGNLSPVMRAARAVKTPFEQSLIKASGVKHSLVYERIPHLYQEGMTDIEFQIEIERASRLEGCRRQRHGAVHGQCPHRRERRHTVALRLRHGRRGPRPVAAHRRQRHGH